MTGPVPRLGGLFVYDWDAIGFGRQPLRLDRASFDLERFAAAQARHGARRGWAGVVSNHEQFGALAAALVAERLGLPGNPAEAVLACQHKLHAR